MGRHARFFAVCLLAGGAALCGRPTIRAHAYPFPGPIGVDVGFPSVTGSSNVPTSGGTSFLLGSGLTNAAFFTYANGVFIPMPATAETPTTAAVSVPALTTGIYDLFASAPNGMAISFKGLLHVSTVEPPSTTFAGHLRDWGICANATCSGGCTNGSAITSVPDSSGNNNTMTALGTVTYTTNDTHFRMPSITTCAFAGTTGNGLANSAFSLGSSNTISVLGAYYLSGTVNNQAIWEYSQIAMAPTDTGNLVTLSENNAVNATTTMALGGTTFIYYGNDVSSGTNTHSLDLAINNGVHGTASGNTGSLIATGATFTIGSLNGPLATAAGSAPEWIVIDERPTTAQLTTYTGWINGEYGATAPPVFTASTVLNANTAGAAVRISGSGFEGSATLTVSANVAGVPTACTVVSNTTTTIDATCPSIPPGTYDLSITNPDQRVTTTGGGLTAVANTCDPMSTIGLSVHLWCGADQVTLNTASPCSSGAPCVASCLDKSLFGNTLAQATGADQPLYNASNTTFVTGHTIPTIDFNGSSDFFLQSALGLGNSAPSLWVVAVLKQTGTPGSNNVAVWYGTSLEFLVSFLSGKPATQYQYDYSHNITWGSAVSTANNMMFGATQGTSLSDGGTAIADYVNVANGTALDAGFTITNPIQNGVSFTAGARDNGGSPGNYWQGSIAELVLVNSDPTANAAAIETCAQTRFGVP